MLLLSRIGWVWVHGFCWYKSWIRLPDAFPLTLCHVIFTFKYFMKCFVSITYVFFKIVWIVISGIWSTHQCLLHDHCHFGLNLINLRLWNYSWKFTCHSCLQQGQFSNKSESPITPHPYWKNERKWLMCTECETLSGEKCTLHRCVPHNCEEFLCKVP